MADEKKVKISITKKIVFNGQEVTKTAEADLTETQAANSEQIIKSLFAGLFEREDS